MNQQILEEASEWVVKQRDGGLVAQEKAAFDSWLRESPQHVRAYLEMSAVWEDVPSLDPDWNPSAEELIALARADDNVVPLVPVSASLGRTVSRAASAMDAASENEQGTAEAKPAGIVAPASRIVPDGPSGIARSRIFYAIAATLLIALASGWFYLQRGVYSTEVGEQRLLALADGSTVELNARSRIRVEYTGEERRIELLEGQALFHVAKNKLRPFIVHTSNTKVRAVGTAFDVNKTLSGTVVTVVEGRVAVHAGGAARPNENTAASGNAGGSAVPDVAGTAIASGDVHLAQTSAIQAGAGEILLGAGEQVVVTPSASASPTKADLSAATAWTRRSLIFDSSPLTAVAEEFNRYSTRRLVIEDPALASFLVSGVFSSAEPTLLLRFLHGQPELVVEETDKEIRISKR